MKTVIAALVALGTIGASAPAFADKCKAPKVTFKNDKSVTIKMTKIYYHDGCDDKERTEDVASTEIEPGKSHTFTDDLEYVGNCAIKYFAAYRAERANTGSAYGSYSKGGNLTPDQGASQKCNTGVTYTVHLHD